MTIHANTRYSFHFLSIVILLSLMTGVLGATGTSEILNPHTMSWQEIQEAASGTEVRFAMWGGSAEINAWIDSLVAPALEEETGVILRRIPMDAPVFVNKLLTEKQAGRTEGTIDLLWINGENFKNAKEAGLLWGPYTEKLPHFNQYVDPSTASTDFGYPTEGYEAPYGKAWYIFEYDSAKISAPPADFDALTRWIKDNPGQFTYPQPPDFTGSAFLRLAFYYANGGYEPFLEGFSEEKAQAGVQKLVAWLEEIEPYLWQEGRTYPRDSAAMDALFERGEVAFNMSYNVSHASNKIATGQYPPSVRSFAPAKSALYNLHFTAIPFNAPNKAAALVLSNHLLSPAMQLSKNNPANWGDLTVLDPSKLTPQDAKLFASLDLGPATLSLAVLAKEGVPEIPASYIEYIESAWEEEILRK
ncbi:MAG: ABC transporter substrate-binding protein [Spirochaetales bacterium]|nr:ABC transporter substrate-binding protein [Spirochaetales bacterium]